MRARIALKKQLRGLFSEDERADHYVLLRDPEDNRYPGSEEHKAPPPRRWQLARVITLRSPDHLAVMVRERLARIAPDGKSWDAISEYDVSEIGAENHLRGAHAWMPDDERSDRHQRFFDFWEEYVTEADQAYLKVIRFVPLDRILALDPIGDGHFPVPHLLVPFDQKHGPFDERVRPILERRHGYAQRNELRPSEDNRVKFFPSPLPDEIFPPPPDLDYSRATKAAALSGGTRERLSALAVRLSGARATAREAAAQAASNLGERLLPFQSWMDQVAVPVLAAFVESLRSSGHGAHILVRPEPGDSEMLELRVQLLASSVHNPTYRLKGHVRFSASAYAPRIHTIVSPPADDARGAPPSSTAGYPTAQEIESLVLAMLDRLTKRG